MEIPNEVRLDSNAIKPSVAILLATCNGSPWIDDQLDSIFRQEGVNPKVYLVDDFSTDDTVAKVKDWQKRGHAIEIQASPEKKVGIPGIYFHLMSFRYPEDYLALCDQDDVWNESHLFASISVLKGKNCAIAISPRDFIDSSGSIIGSSLKLRRPPSVSNAMVENIAFGNTIVMTVDLLEALSVYTPRTSIMHDSWIYLWASVFGEVIRHEKVGVKYRLHDKNAVGIRRMNSFSMAISNMRGYVRQNQEFLMLYGDLNQNGINEVKSFLNNLKEVRLFPRIFYALGNNFYRQNKFESCAIKLLFIVKPKLFI